MREQVRLHKEKAAGFLARGRYKAAAKQYLLALKLAPDDVGLRQKLGDIYSRLGDIERATGEYQHVAGRYAAEGFLLKAMAICKVILAIDPGHTETQHTLAKLYAAHQGETSEKTLPPSMSGALRAQAAADMDSGPSIHPAVDAERSRPVATAHTPRHRESHREAVQSSSASSEPEAQSELSSSAWAPADPAAMQGIAPGDASVGEASTAGGQRARAGNAESGRQPHHDHDASDVPSRPVQEQGDGQKRDGDTDSLDLDVLSHSGATSSSSGIDETGEVDLEMDIVEGTPISTSENEELAEIDAQFARAEKTTLSMTGIPPIPLFSQLDPEAFVLMFDHLELRTVGAGVKLVTEGERGHEMFIIVQGHVEVVRERDEERQREEEVVDEMTDGAFFGEMALLADAPRMASVRTTRDTAILVIDRDTLNHIATLHPSIAEVALTFYRERLLANLLRSNALFSPFSHEEKQAIMDGFQSATVQEGTVLLESGQEGDGLYLLLRGTCEVLEMSDEGDVLRYPDLREGDVFGEISLLVGNPVSATVRTTSESVVLRLDRETFYERIMCHPDARQRMTELVNERLKRTAEMRAQLQMGGGPVV